MAFKNLKELPFKESNYIKPKRFAYESKGKIATWDFIEAKDSVSVLLYHKEWESFIFVRQFRIPLWYYQLHDQKYKKNENMGYTIELCSGLVDKNLSLEEIAKEECIEELGYAPKILEKIGDFYTGFGSGVSRQSFYFAQVDENDRVSSGGGIDDEEIEAIYIKVQDFEAQCKDMIRTPLLDFAYMWFLKEKWKK
ncbi:NUDIX domain-containing protein [Campylobacter sp. VicNov18]|uniref:NUDIX domain-containing protein n=1 Tax=Campylobacter bilis TaxID=2691918 RepID=UPI00130DE20C|nr:NUDIX domain-containing protein [Campylobacter bilis]MPV63991.1 NUDIX hydrolase [Campylobacter hepaticus]MBM0637492.1 NUDIX domain-containing protein [Campylobacter bilis]MCC8278215.1 NUDIX domain-containing protein [Campylobacter bilis]MCC8299719.1 NUDIX domain-containing protein [Campylobacter bilis]MCC8301124.1 NUDIX domain-containing protein [Campylobacter bilis]